MSGASTYNLSNVFRALGIRDPRAIPTIAGAMLAPVVVLGTFEAFAPQVIEARGYISAALQNVLLGQSYAVSHQSTAPGGTIIENIVTSDGATLNLAPVKPFTGSVVVPFTMGGQVISSIFEQSGIVVGPLPSGASLGGSNTDSLHYEASKFLGGNIWIPPSWFFWAMQPTTSPNTNAWFAWRFREIPQSQGPA